MDGLWIVMQALLCGNTVRMSKTIMENGILAVEASIMTTASTLPTSRDGRILAIVYVQET
jgi:hypothetical protein